MIGRPQLGATGLAMFTALLLLAAPPPLAGQTAGIETRPGSQELKSPFAAGALEWLVPSAGFAYAGQWRRGLLPAAVRVGGFVLAVSRNDGRSDDSVADIGLAVALAGTVWGIVGAVQSVNEHNERVRAGSVSPTVGRAPGGGVSVGIRLGF